MSFATRVSLRPASMAGAGLAILAMLVTLGCNAQQRVPTADEAVSFELHASQTHLMVGEIATITTSSQNTLGRDTRVEWRTTGGELVTEQAGRVARVQFDEPGRYTVEGTLIVDGTLFLRDNVTINVRPLR